MFNRKIRVRLDLIKPSKPKSNYNRVNSEKTTVDFKNKQRIAARNYSGTKKWLFGRVIKRTGKLHYEIALDDGRIWRRHVNQLRIIGENIRRELSKEKDKHTGEELDYYSEPEMQINIFQRHTGQVQQEPESDNESIDESTELPNQDTSANPQLEQEAPDRPKRSVKPPAYLQDYVRDSEPGNSLDKGKC
ncbi:hypothetical protein RF55_19218 [Lasius niger]|uniref:Uncharacterized protein n=1 Tax=Lasius niger TaxID=67767 RepID=A0A0J7K0P8_LASNI|nr:hypothetical protein RF55_19218 [Lasius niger]